MLALQGPALDNMTHGLTNNSLPLSHPDIINRRQTVSLALKGVTIKRILKGCTEVFLRGFGVDDYAVMHGVDV